MQRLSGSIVAVRLCLNAACPAGVSGNLNSGRSLPMFPTGVVSRVPFQYPLRSGWPSAIRGVGLLDLKSGAVSPCADIIRGKRKTAEIAALRNSRFGFVFIGCLRCREYV